ADCGAGCRADESRRGVAEHRRKPGSSKSVLQPGVRNDAVLRVLATRPGRGWFPELAQHAERGSEQLPAHDLWLPLLDRVSPEIRPLIVIATKSTKGTKSKKLLCLLCFLWHS